MCQCYFICNINSILCSDVGAKDHIETKHIYVRSRTCSGGTASLPTDLWTSTTYYLLHNAFHGAPPQPDISSCSSEHKRQRMELSTCSSIKRLWFTASLIVEWTQRSQILDDILSETPTATSQTITSCAQFKVDWMSDYRARKETQRWELEMNLSPPCYALVLLYV